MSLWNHMYSLGRYPSRRFRRSLSIHSENPEVLIFQEIEDIFGRKVARRVLDIIHIFQNEQALKDYCDRCEDTHEQLLNKGHTLSESRPFDQIIKMQSKGSKTCNLLTNYELILTDLKLAQIAFDAAKKYNYYDTVHYDTRSQNNTL